MELLEKLGCLGTHNSYGIFLCPVCLQKVIKTLDHGLRDKSCGCNKNEHLKGNKYNLGKKRTEEFKQKNRDAHIGKKRTEEQRQKIRNAVKNSIHKENCNCWTCKSRKGLNKGENNPMYGKKGELSPVWQGGKSFEIYPIGFKQIKKFILERDNYTCQYPGCTEVHDRLNVHHIDYDKKNNNTENLITLGTSCHTKTNFNRLFWIEFYQNIMINKLY